MFACIETKKNEIQGIVIRLFLCIYVWYSSKWGVTISQWQCVHENCHIVSMKIITGLITIKWFFIVCYKHHNKNQSSDWMMDWLRILFVTMKRMMMIYMMMMMIMGSTIGFCYGRSINWIAAFIFFTHSIYDKHYHQNGTQ